MHLTWSPRALHQDTLDDQGQANRKTKSQARIMYRLRSCEGCVDSFWKQRRLPKSLSILSLLSFHDLCLRPEFPKLVPPTERISTDYRLRVLHGGVLTMVGLVENLHSYLGALDSSSFLFAVIVSRFGIIDKALIASKGPYHLEAFPLLCV